jgi:hypothetical protein
MIKVPGHQKLPLNEDMRVNQLESPSQAMTECILIRERSYIHIVQYSFSPYIARYEYSFSP